MRTYGTPEVPGRQHVRTPATGRGASAPDYVESLVTQHMEGRDISIEIDLGVGRGRASVWTCDLTHGYIDINADYRS